MKPLKVKELYDLCKSEMMSGNGNKTIMISNDDEGNGYHYLWYAFSNAKEIFDDEEEEYYIFHGCIDKDIATIEDTIILG